MEAEVIPFPREEQTPPVTKMYLVISEISYRKILQHRKNYFNTKKAPHRARLFWNIRFLSHTVLESLSSLERWKFHRWDLNLLIWVSWVDACSSGTFRNSECTKSSDGDILSLSKALGDRAEDGIEYILSSFLGNAGSVCCRGNKILLGHTEELKDRRGHSSLKKALVNKFYQEKAKRRVNIFFHHFFSHHEAKKEK